MSRNSRYRRDRDTGAVYADGGLYGIRSIDLAREADEDFGKMLERRSGEVLAETRPPMTVGRRLHLERFLGWRDSLGIGQVPCKECDKMNRTDSSYCAACGSALQPTTIPYAGVDEGETVECKRCGRMNSTLSNYCTGCGRDLRLTAVVAPAPAAGHRPSGQMRSAEPEFGFGRGNRFCARKSFDFIDSVGISRHIKVGVSFVTKDSEAFRLHPSAEFWAA